MALLSEKEKQQLKQIIADYPNNEDLDLTAYIAEVIGITGNHVEEGWYNQDINDTHITFSRKDLERDSKRDHERTELGTTGIHTSN